MLELDPTLQALILAGVTWLVTEGLKSLSGALNKDLSGMATAIVAGLMGIILAALSGVLSFIPPEYHQLAQVLMTLIVTILGAFGVHGIIKKSRNSYG